MNISLKRVRRLLDLTYNRYDCMVREHPKAAKKKRNRKKWLRRFGAPIDWGALIDQPSFMSSLVDGEQFVGAVINVPYRKQT